MKTKLTKAKPGTKLSQWAYRLVIGVLVGTSLAACGGGTAPPTDPKAESESRLDTIRQRGEIICGVSGKLPGFSFLAEDGTYSGIDADMCRAVAAALFGDADAVTFREVSATERFTALQTGEVDLLSRNTTWTLNRDTALGLEFAPVVFYDGQGLLVRRADDIDSFEDLADKAICLQAGTTTELNIADRMRGISYSPLVFQDADEVYAAYEADRCQAVTTDRSGLVSRRSQLADPEAHVILDETISKEPLAPAVAAGDAKWLDIVRWSVLATIEAEELDITSDNISATIEAEQQAMKVEENNPLVSRFLGVEGALGQDIGLEADFAAQIIQQVGNYGEIYDRNLGPQTPLNLPRGQNQLWTQNGGLLYSPPFR